MTTHRTPGPDHAPVFSGPVRPGPGSTDPGGISRALIVLGAGTGTAAPSHDPPHPARTGRGSAKGGAV